VLVDLRVLMGPIYRPVEMEIAALAARQHGVVALAQLVALGLCRGAVAIRAVAGLLLRGCRGGSAVGHAGRTKRGWWMAAVLACGDGALLSHLSAAELYVLRRSGNTIDVTSPTRSRSGLKGIRLHQPRTLAPEHCTTIDGIPVTTIPRLIVDLAGMLDATGLKRVSQEADRQRLLDVEAVKRLTHQPRKGIGKVIELIEAAEDTPDTKEEFEHRFHDFLTERPDIPRPVYNTLVEGYLVDVYWPRHGVIVELQSRTFHWHKTEDDADRFGDLIALGYRVYPVTWRALTREPEKVAGRLRRLLRTAPSPTPAARADAA
jgi:hypothetical protein